MLNIKRYFAIIAISFIAFSCQKSRERFVPTPLEPYVSKVSVKINGEPIANATTVTATSDSTKINIAAVVSGKNINISIDRIEGVGSYPKTIDGVKYKLTYVDGASNLTARPTGSIISVGYLDTKLKVVRGEFECRLPNGTTDTQLSQGTFDVQF